MKKGLFSLIFLLAFIGHGLSQSIPSYWMNIYNLDDLYISRTDNVKQIIANVTGYYSSGETYKEKWIYNFIAPNKIAGQTYKEGQLTSSFEYVLNDSGIIVLKTTSFKQPLVGWQSMIIKYEYEAGNLKYEKHYSKEKELIDYVQFDYDSSNRPNKMSLFNATGELRSYETAEYNENEGTYNYKVFDSSGSLITEEKEYFNLDKTSNQYNKQGDLAFLKWPTSNPNKDVFHRLEYKYDDMGNWIKRTWIILVGKKANKRSTISRKIIYTKTN